MAASSQPLTQVSIAEEHEGIPPVSTLGLGVDEAALHVFSNFVQQITSNVGETSNRAENRLATRSQLRRSARFANAQTLVPDPCPATLPTPLEAKVRAAVCAPSVIAQIRVRGASCGYRVSVAARPWVPLPRAWAHLTAIISWLGRPCPDGSCCLRRSWEGRSAAPPICSRG